MSGGRNYFTLDTGTLDIPVGTAQHAANRLREDHKEAIRIFREASNVEKALFKQLTAALPSFYLKQYRSELTNTFNQPLNVVLTNLFQAYGAIESVELANKE